MHWNLVRVTLDREDPKLEVFEPMGKPTSRGGRGQGMSFRSMPRAVVHWLDHVAPLNARQRGTMEVSVARRGGPAGGGHRNA